MYSKRNEIENEEKILTESPHLNGIFFANSKTKRQGKNSSKEKNDIKQVFFGCNELQAFGACMSS